MLEVVSIPEPPKGDGRREEGDGGHPEEALLDRPFGVAVDQNDNVYIVDTFNNRIRVVRK